MKLMKLINRPSASFTCPTCRRVNIVEEEDLAGEKGLIALNCLSCGHDHNVDVAYMKKLLARD